MSRRNHSTVLAALMLLVCTGMVAAGGSQEPPNAPPPPNNPPQFQQPNQRVQYTTRGVYSFSTAVRFNGGGTAWTVGRLHGWWDATVVAMKIMQHGRWELESVISERFAPTNAEATNIGLHTASIAHWWSSNSGKTITADIIAQAAVKGVKFPAGMTRASVSARASTIAVAGL